MGFDLMARGVRAGKLPTLVPVPLVHDEAVCIRHWDWSETSQTISLFTREHGVIRCVAKGAKREKSNFSGGVELLTRAELVVSIKSTGALSILTSWDLIETFSHARRSLGSFHAGMAILDVCQHSLHEADPHPELYDAVIAAIRKLGSGEGSGANGGNGGSVGDASSNRASVLAVLWAALYHTGHAPELLIDIHTSNPLTKAEVYHFMPALGGIAAPSSNTGHNAGAVIWKVRASTIHLLQRLAPDGTYQLESQADEDVGVNHEHDEETQLETKRTAKRALALLFTYFQWVFSIEAAAIKSFIEIDQKS